jgi:photosystem II stability/assembly factor-like uncharacterized protein
MRKIYILILLVGTSFFCFSQRVFTIDTINLNVNSSFRALSVVNDSIIWVCGSNGYAGYSRDGGKKWNVRTIPGYEKTDFRDIEGFDDQTAIVMNSGSPAYFLKTTDAGSTWKIVYTNDDKKIFFNAMDFWDKKKGIAFSDPIDGKLFLISTSDGGKSWKEIPYKDCPQTQDGEAGFAASGTALRTTGDGFAFIGTGGKAAHLFSSDDYGKTWKKFSCPILKFKETTGIFSIAFKDQRTGIAVGGDYAADSLSEANCFLTFNGGKIWKSPITPPLHYRSCVEYFTLTYLITTGPSGTDISYDGGQTWKNISNIGFNVVRKSKRGNKVLLGGNNGRIGFLSEKK